MTFDRSYIVYLGSLGIDFFKSVMMYSKGAICLSRLLLNLGLFAVQDVTCTVQSTCLLYLSLFFMDLVLVWYSISYPSFGYTFLEKK